MSAATEPVWTAATGEVDVGPVIVRDVAVFAVEDSLVALTLETGGEAWRRSDVGRVRQLAADPEGMFLFVTSDRRLDVLDPTDGDPVPRCGFDLPNAFAATVVDAEAVFVAITGSAHTIDTNPGSDPCHPHLPTETLFDARGDVSSLASRPTISSSGHASFETTANKAAASI